jgi:hypothetical protein
MTAQQQAPLHSRPVGVIRRRRTAIIGFTAVAAALGAALLAGTSPLADDEADGAALFAQEAASEPLARVLGQLESRSAQLPRDRMDPSAVVATTRKPAELLAWVRDNTRYVSYDGSLRGPFGVLADRRGNSLDRALLLASLLDLAGYETQVVGGKLSGPDARDGLPSAAADQARGDAPHAPNALDGTVQRATDIAAAITRAAGSLPVSPTQVAELTHYWVRYRDGQQWVDADPTLQEIGKTRTHTDAVHVPIDPNTHGVARTSSLGKGMTHSVMMRLVVERWDAGRLIESRLAEIPLDPSAGPLAATAVTFVPVDERRQQVEERPFTSGAELRELLLAETTWALVVRDASSRWRMGRMFDETGTVGVAPGMTGADRMGAATSSALGGLLSLGGDEEESAVLTALMADYEIHVAGRPARVVRRFIFDSLGPEARRAATASLPRPAWTDQQRAERGANLAALNDTVVAFASLPVELYALRYAQRVIESKEALLQVDTGSEDEVALDQAENGIAIRTLELFAATRDSTLSPQLAITEPQIYRRTIRCVPDTNATGLTVQVHADLAWNRLGSVTGAAAMATVVTQGVLDTLQESAIVLHEPVVPDQTTAALLDEAAKQGIEIVAVRDPRDPHLPGYPGPARARMLNDLETGHILVAPAQAVAVKGQPRLGWWRLDPSSGHVVGAMDTGLLQGDTDYATTHEINGIKFVKFKKPPPTPGPAARAYVRDLAARKPGISEDALKDIAIAVQRYILKTGSLPL